MQPEQPPAPPPITLPPGTSVASGQTSGQYDFFMNPAKPKKRLLPGGNPVQKILIVVALGVVFLILIVVLLSVLSGGQSNVDKLVSITQQQQEIQRIADVGLEKGQGAAARNLAVTTKLSVQSSQVSTLERLKKLGRNVKTKELALEQSKSTDEKLTTAALNNRFDETFTTTLQTTLGTYKTAVKQIYDTSKNPGEKQIMAIAFNGVGLLVASTTPETTD